jgi:hypothetical protein
MASTSPEEPVGRAVEACKESRRVERVEAERREERRVEGDGDCATS